MRLCASYHYLLGAGSWPAATDKKNFNPDSAFEGNSREESAERTSEKLESSQQELGTEKVLEKPASRDNQPVTEEKEGVGTDNAVHTEAEEYAAQEEKVLKAEEDGKHIEPADGTIEQKLDHGKEENQLPVMPVELSELTIQNVESSVSVESPQENEIGELKTPASIVSMQPNSVDLGEDQVDGNSSEPGESQGVSDVQDNFQVKTEEKSKEEESVQAEESVEQVSPVQPEVSGDSKDKDETKPSVATEETGSIDQSNKEHLTSASPPNESSDVVPKLGLHENEATFRAIEGGDIANDVVTDTKEQHLSPVKSMSDSDSLLELEKVKREMKMMETAIQGAARQAQVFPLLHLIIIAAKIFCGT